MASPYSPILAYVLPKLSSALDSASVSSLKKMDGKKHLHYVSYSHGIKHGWIMVGLITIQIKEDQWVWLDFCEITWQQFVLIFKSFFKPVWHNFFQMYSNIVPFKAKAVYTYLSLAMSRSRLWQFNAFWNLPISR